MEKRLRQLEYSSADVAAEEVIERENTQLVACPDCGRESTVHFKEPKVQVGRAKLGSAKSCAYCNKGIQYFTVREMEGAKTTIQVVAQLVP